MAASKSGPKAGRRIWSSLVGVVAVGAILVGINLLAETRLPNAQIDLTQQKLYTLSPGTRTILAGLKEPITLRMYYSSALGSSIPVYGAYADRVRQVLEQYASLSNGKVQLQFLNPEPFSDTEDRAMAAGLQGVPLDQSGTQVYFGLAGTNLLDDTRNITFFQPEREPFLEYDLTRLIYELSNPTRPVVGVMTALPVDGDPRMMMSAQGPTQGGAPWASMQQLRQSFTVKTVPVDAQVIAPDIQVLLVAHPQNLSDLTQYAIDQFVMRGGRLMALVDPHSEAQAGLPTQTGQPPDVTWSDLPKLFAGWGIQYNHDAVIGDLTGAWHVQGTQNDRTVGVDYVPWFNIRDGISKDDPSTADLTQITVASTGSIATAPNSTLTMTPLLSSDGKTGPVPAASVRVQPDPVKVLAGFKPEGGPKVIAGRFHGPLKSAFTGPPALPKDVKRPDNFPAYIAKTDNASMVISADSDILADRFWVTTQDFFGQSQATPFSDDGPFVANLVGSLAGSDALMGLRSRGTSQRPFEMVDNMRAAAQARYQDTQKTLQAHLDDATKKLTDLRSGKGDTASAVITDQQRATIDDLRRDITDTRGKLRNVQLELNRDIAALENELRVFDIVLVPAILVVLALILSLVRRRRRAAARS